MLESERSGRRAIDENAVVPGSEFRRLGMYTHDMSVCMAVFRSLTALLMDARNQHSRAYRNASYLEKQIGRRIQLRVQIVAMNSGGRCTTCVCVT